MNCSPLIHYFRCPQTQQSFWASKLCEPVSFSFLWSRSIYVSPVVLFVQPSKNSSPRSHRLFLLTCLNNCGASAHAHNIFTAYSQIFLMRACLHSPPPDPCPYMHLWRLFFLLSFTNVCPTPHSPCLLSMSASLTFQLLQIWMEIQMTPDEPRYWAVSKPRALDNIPSLLQQCREGGRGMLSTWSFSGIYDPRPHQLSLPLLALLSLAGISRRGKQTNYKETNTTANKHVVTWRESFQQDASFERQREGKSGV